MPSVAPPAGTTGLTYADLLALPEPSEAGGTRYELLDGELLVTPSGVPRHQQAIMRIASALHAWTEAHGGETLPAPMDVVFSDTTVLQPDVLVLTADHLDRIGRRAIEGPPDLAVEVSSPSTRRTDVVRKRRVYEREGVREFWFVDLDTEQVQVYVLGADGIYAPPTVVMPGSEVRSPVLTGFAMPADRALAL
jgi:Uma2 family endonuclease